MRKYTLKATRMDNRHGETFTNIGTHIILSGRTETSTGILLLMCFWVKLKFLQFNFETSKLTPIFARPTQYASERRAAFAVLCSDEVLSFVAYFSPYPEPFFVQQLGSTSSNVPVIACMYLSVVTQTYTLFYLYIISRSVFFSELLLYGTIYTNAPAK